MTLKLSMHVLEKVQTLKDPQRVFENNSVFKMKSDAVLLLAFLLYVCFMSCYAGFILLY